MFQIQLSLIQKTNKNLEMQYRMRRMIIDDLYDMKRKLIELFGMEEVINGINKEITQLESQQEGMRKMIVGLSKIIDTYACCENRIIDNEESFPVIYERLKVCIFDINGVATSMDDLF